MPSFTLSLITYRICLVVHWVNFLVGEGPLKWPNESASHGVEKGVKVQQKFKSHNFTTDDYTVYRNQHWYLESNNQTLRYSLIVNKCRLLPKQGVVTVYASSRSLPRYPTACKESTSRSRRYILSLAWSCPLLRSWTTNTSHTC